MTADIADEIMPAAEMKAVLKQAQLADRRIPVAVVLDTEGLAAVFATRKGKAKNARSGLLAAVRKKALQKSVRTDAQSCFFGYGTTDPGSEGILKLTLNKQPPSSESFAHKVFLRVRGAGFAKVVLFADPGIEGEDEDLTAEDDIHDAAVLHKQLGELIPHIATHAGPDHDTLLALAAAGTQALKQERLADAAAAIGRLRTALDIAAHTTPGVVDFAKPRLIWLATRKKARDETGRLRAAIDAHYAPQGIATPILDRYDAKVGELFSELDESLAVALDAAGAEHEVDARARLVQEARGIIGRYEAALSRRPMTDLENNPFEKLAMADMLANSLKVLSATLK